MFLLVWEYSVFIRCIQSIVINLFFWFSLEALVQTGAFIVVEDTLKNL